MKKIIIIWWAPATWKTTLAKKLSKKMNHPWISTDFIRNWMISLVSQKDYPNLFNFSDMTAEEHYSNDYNVEKSIEKENLRDWEVFKWIKEFIKANKQLDDFIIEGISVHPKNLAELELLGYEIFPIFLVDTNIQRIKNILYSRWLWDDASKYPDWIKEKELNYLVKTNLYYISELERLNIPYFKIGTERNKTIIEINNYLNKNFLNIS